jgi:hypothetical protein
MSVKDVIAPNEPPKFKGGDYAVSEAIDGGLVDPWVVDTAPLANYHDSADEVYHVNAHVYYQEDQDVIFHSFCSDDSPACIRSNKDQNHYDDHGELTKAIHDVFTNILFPLFFGNSILFVLVDIVQSLPVHSLRVHIVKDSAHVHLLLDCWLRS